MAKDILSAIKEKRLYFDGGTGTVLQSMGLPKGMAPEKWNVLEPEKIIKLHSAYIDAGCNILKTNTFGINAEKYENYEELIKAAMDCAKLAVNGKNDVFIAFDMGPTGQLLKPLGSLDFEAAIELFARNVRKACEYGADAILIETMNDSYETKAAVIAAKENCDLPIFVTNVYDERGKLMTGADAVSMIAMLEGLGVDALGMNCSLGPDKMLDILPKFVEYSSVPIIVNPNAGIPVEIEGRTVFGTNAEEFSDYMLKMSEMGASLLGGCCGTTPEYIKKTIEKTKNTPYKLPELKNHTLVSSYTHSVEIGKKTVLIGERINPTGKPKLKAALKENNISYILNEAVAQEEAGVQILDVNVGLPEIDEAAMLKTAVFELQSVTALPLQLDSVNPKALEAAMRIYNGKPLVNSVNGEDEKLKEILPLVKKYGGTLIALTIDENGIPKTADERAKIVEKIEKAARQYGINKKDIVVDPLALTISSDTENAIVTLKSIKKIKDMGFCTSLGVSNISFGLPGREKINSVFFAMALEEGLDCAIMNPFAKTMMDVYYAYNVLSNKDPACSDFIEYAKLNSEEGNGVVSKETEYSLKYIIEKGMKDIVDAPVRKLLESQEPLSIINNEIIPALNKIGMDFEKGVAFLPQLLMSAEAASKAFELIKAKMPQNAADNDKSVVLATVKGDIHDIGKNIVKVMLQSYGFTVYDLGKDVAPEVIVDYAVEKNCNVVGLSALMTTTVPAMEETIHLVRQQGRDIKVMVGGAVLNKEYADMIGADFYASDAMAAVRISEEIYG